MSLWNYSAGEIRSMPDDALGLLVLEEFGQPGWNVDSFFTRSGFANELIGVALMTAAFNPKTGPLADPAAEGGEQEAAMALYRGANRDL